MSTLRRFATRAVRDVYDRIGMPTRSPIAARDRFAPCLTCGRAAPWRIGR